MSDARYPAGTLLLGKLEIVRCIGAGAMGEVYEVKHRLTNHRRAIKVLRADLARRGSAVTRLVREAGIAAELGNARLVETFDAGVLDDGSPYILMELLRGRSLAQELDVRGRLDAASAAALARQVCEGMQAAHDAGVVHRDLKPGNLFLIDAQAWSLKILDFGVAKLRAEDAPHSASLTREGTVLGTPHYMSPEQAMAQKDVDHRTDVYALGVILYECLTGRLPYPGGSFLELLAQLHVGEFPKIRELEPSVPAELEAIVERAMERDRELRIDSMAALAEALEPFAQGAERTRVEGDGETLSDERWIANRSVSTLDEKSESFAETIDAARALPTEAISMHTLAATVDAPVRSPPPLPARESSPKRALGAVFAAVALGAIGFAAFQLGAQQQPPLTTTAPPPVTVEEPMADQDGGAPAERTEPVTLPEPPPSVPPARGPRWPRAVKAGLPNDNPYGEP